MNYDNAIKVVNKGAKLLGKSTLADKRYYAIKTSNEFTCLKQNEDTKKWESKEETDINKGDTVIMLNDCNDAKTGMLYTVVANANYVNWALKTPFSFDVKDGRTNIDNEPLTSKQLKDLLKN